MGFEMKSPKKQSKLSQSNGKYFYSYTLALKLQLIFNKSISCKQRLRILRIKKKKKDAVIYTSVLPTVLPIIFFDFFFFLINGVSKFSSSILQINDEKINNVLLFINTKCGS